MHQFVSIKFSCLIESNVSSAWHWVMSHCCDISDIWPIRGQYCVPLTNKKPDNEMNGLSLRCCDSLDRPVVTRVSLTMDPGEIKGAALGPHTSPDVTAREDHTLCCGHIITPGPGYRQLSGHHQGHYYYWKMPHKIWWHQRWARDGSRLGLSSEWRQLVCWELTKAAWAISTSDHLGPQSHTSLYTWEGLEINNHEKNAYLFSKTTSMNLPPRHWCSILVC